MKEQNYNSEEFSFLEPYGHSSPHSKLERYWRSFSGPFSLRRQRVTQYSVYAGMMHSPLKYIMRRFTLSPDLPTEKWILDNLQDFVRTEFSESDHSMLAPPVGWPPKVDEVIYLPEHVFDKFLEASEWGQRMNIKLPNENSPIEIASSIYDLLCDTRVGSSKNSKNNNRDEFINRIIATIKEKSRLLFVLPGFPFKDQNRFRVPFEGSIPDMGEISFMIRLYNLTQILYQVHPYGVDVVVLSDGELYSDIFGISEETVSSYTKRLIAYRNRFNLQGAISFLSLKELINRSSDNSGAWNIAAYLRTYIKNLVESGEPNISETFRILVSGMKWNLESRNNLAEIDDEVCWKLLRWQEGDIEEKHKELWHQVNNKATAAALEYASINLMLRWTDLISSFFPDAIRGTVHPKRGQFALAGSGGSYAWNGVAWAKEWPNSIDDIRIIPFMSLNDFPSVRQVRFEHTGLPCFYTGSNLDKNLETAKHALPANGWFLDNIYGRELSVSDLKDFIELGLKDKNFSWERKLQTENYFTGLFQFRISHYKRYGFGVHGVWLNGKLIGQFGLQVLKEDLNEIEIVIFLGEEFVHQGLGSKLLWYIINKCREIEMVELYGVVRPDNYEGLNLVKKFGGIPIKTIKHFNHEGILHVFNLKSK